jgi:hypothetical protein
MPEYTNHPFGGLETKKYYDIAVMDTNSAGLEPAGTLRGVKS